MKKEILSIKKFNNYEIRKEKVFPNSKNLKKYIIFENVYNLNGDYIGNVVNFKGYLCTTSKYLN